MNGSSMATSRSGMIAQATGEHDTETEAGDLAIKEQELIARLRNRDKAAFNELVQTHYNRVYRVVYGILKHEENAKDVAQQVWVKVWNKFDTFKGDAALGTWLYRIAHFTALDAVRANRKHRKLDSIDASHDDDEIKPIQLASNVEEEHPHHYMKKREIMERFTQAIDGLSESHRTILVLREIEGLSYESIAEILKCRIGTVMSRLFNARRAIQHEMEDLK
jgi:RNA polymerase sigma-70 factor (ECF subfamily)